MPRIRRVAMLTVLASLWVCTAWTRARATVDAELLAGTQGLLGIPVAFEHGRPRALVLNGAQLEIRSGHSKDPLRTLLERATADCRRRSGRLHARAMDIAAHAKRLLPSLADGILRSEHAGEGLVACFDLGQRETSWDELLARLQAFARSGDLEALGGIRLLRVQARSEGAFFVTLASVGPTELSKMFPAEGDAPGLDFKGVPRPLGGRRVLSAWQQHGAPALNIYEAELRGAHLLRDYQRLLLAHGWRLDGTSRSSATDAPAMLLIKDGHQLVLSAETEGARILVAVMLLDAGPGAI